MFLIFSKHPRHRNLALVDIEGSTGVGRDDHLRGVMRQALYHLLEAALAVAGIGRPQYRFSDRGDGVLVVIDPEVPKVQLVGAFVEQLASGLRRYNHAASDAARIRLRVVIHAGEVAQDQYGFHGADLSFAFRLLDSEQARDCLARTAAPLALLVADDLYWRVIRQNAAEVDPAPYRPLCVSAKEVSALAWVYTPGRAPAFCEFVWLVA